MKYYKGWRALNSNKKDWYMLFWVAVIIVMFII